MGRRAGGTAVAAAWLSLWVAVAACSGGSSPVPSAATSAAPSAAPSSPVDGVVIAVEATGPTKVESFTIRTDAGEELTFALGTLRSDSFPPGHLAEHKSTAERIQVTFVVDGDRLVATGLADAP